MTSMVAGLVTLAAEAAAVGVIVGMLLAWGLTGGDGVDAHPLPALLGLVLFGATILTLVVVIGLYDGWTGAAVVSTVIAVIAGASASLSWRPAERDRRPLYRALAVAAVLLPVAVGFLGDAHAAGPRHLALAAVAPAALALALAPPWGDRATRWDPTMLAALLILLAPLGLLAATLLT